MKWEVWVLKLIEKKLKLILQTLGQIWKNGMTDAVTGSFKILSTILFMCISVFTEARKLKSHPPHSFAAKVLEIN